ncbi:hypothetical protein ACFSND_04030 [Brevibacillus brevis]|uniref:hypothetical protein n=1 Tax=Brevibacillus brevis TaxID=1393 RepID=UPI00362A6E32
MWTELFPSWRLALQNLIKPMTKTSAPVITGIVETEFHWNVCDSNAQLHLKLTLTSNDANSTACCYEFIGGDQSMRYRKRNPDGSLGEWVYTPAGEEERQQEEARLKEMEPFREENAEVEKMLKRVAVKMAWSSHNRQEKAKT